MLYDQSQSTPSICNLRYTSLGITHLDPCAFGRLLQLLVYLCRSRGFQGLLRLHPTLALRVRECDNNAYHDDCIAFCET